MGNRRKGQGGKQLLEVTRLARRGDGVAFIGQERIYVPGGLPGDKVVAVVSGRPGKRSARIVSIVHSGPYRRSAPCPVAAQCGGCGWMSLDDDAELAFKEDRLLSQFGQKVAVERVGAPLGYRRLVRFHQRGKRVGFYKPGSHHIQPIDHCPVLSDDLNEVFCWAKKALLPHLAGNGHWQLAAGDEGVVLTVTTGELPQPSFYDAVRAGGCAKLAGVWLVADGITQRLVGDEWVRATAADGSSMDLPAGSFGQANGAVNRAIGSLVAELLGSDQRALGVELYSGAGNFTPLLARVCKEVHCVELDERAAKVAAQNGAGASSGQVRVWPGDVDARLTLNWAPWRQAGVVLLDPPRIGARSVAAFIPQTGVDEVIYVSCNPTTFQRDGAMLQMAGFELRLLKGFDMFPNTPHLEVVGHFVRHEGRRN